MSLLLLFQSEAVAAPDQTTRRIRVTGSRGSLSVFSPRRTLESSGARASLSTSGEEPEN